MKSKKAIITVLFLLPFLIGLIGYMQAGIPFANAAYCSFVLYAVNPVSDELNVLIHIARWTAPAALASGLLMTVKALWRRVRSYFTLLHRDAFLLCGDTARLSQMQQLLPHAVLAPEGTCPSRGSCVIDFHEEEDALSFLRSHEAELRGRSVVLCSHNVDMFRNDSDTFRIFNPTELIAREYWFTHPLVTEAGPAPSLTVVLIGFDPLGEKLLTNAILYNVFHRDQRITYHVFGDTALFQGVHRDLQLMVNDSIVYDDGPWTARIDLLKGADRIIFTQTPALNVLMELQEICRSDARIDCCGLDEVALSLLQGGLVRSFGREADVLTREGLLQEKLYDAAKRLNYHYARLYGSSEGNWSAEKMETEWLKLKLNPFTRHSNIAAADYYRISRMLFGDRLNEPDEEMAELEHIRWCRFHYLYHWQYAPGKKDSVNRRHPCLRPYNELSREDQEKDRESIIALNEALAER